MQLILYIRRTPDGPTPFSMHTDFKRERDDTPRINNLMLEIKEQLDKAIEGCAVRPADAGGEK